MTGKARNALDCRGGSRRPETAGGGNGGAASSAPCRQGRWLVRLLAEHMGPNRLRCACVGLYLRLGTDSFSASSDCSRLNGGPMKTLLVPDLLRLLRRDINRAGGQSEWARQMRICRTYINRVLNGRKPPGPSICRALGLKRAALPDVAKLSDATKVVDLEEVSFILREEIEKAGSISAWCQQVGLDRSHISQVLHKRKRLGNKILAAQAFKCAA
jgi:hypothetical protein